MKCKRFFSGLLLAALMLAHIGLFQNTLAGGANVTGPGAGTSTDSDLPGNCQSILAAGGFSGQAPQSSDSGTTVDIGSNNELYVFLSESISTPSGENFDCSEVVECLRQYYRGVTAQAREINVFNAIKEQYPQCIVTGSDGLDLLSNYASRVYQWIAGIIGGVCVLVIVISGIQISIGGLSQEEVSTAKERVVRALVGLVVLFLSAFILYTINPVFFT